MTVAFFAIEKFENNLTVMDKSIIIYKPMDYGKFYLKGLLKYGKGI